MRYLTFENSQEILTSHPKVKGQLEKWFLAGFPDSGSLNNGELEIFLNAQLNYNPRVLYDFFDLQGIRVAITPHPDSHDMWIYYNSDTNHSSSASTRIDAEKKGFLEAFKLLENKL